jgi:hypothetical protein
MLRQKPLEKKIVNKIREHKANLKERKRNQDGLNIHLLWQKEQLEGMLRKKIELGSTMHGLLFN